MSVTITPRTIIINDIKNNNKTNSVINVLKCVVVLNVSVQELLSVVPFCLTNKLLKTNITLKTNIILKISIILNNNMSYFKDTQRKLASTVGNISFQAHLVS